MKKIYLLGFLLIIGIILFSGCSLDSDPVPAEVEIEDVPASRPSGTFAVNIPAKSDGKFSLNASTINIKVELSEERVRVNGGSIINVFSEYAAKIDIQLFVQAVDKVKVWWGWKYKRDTEETDKKSYSIPAKELTSINIPDTSEWADVSDLDYIVVWVRITGDYSIKSEKVYDDDID